MTEKCVSYIWFIFLFIMSSSKSMESINKTELQVTPRQLQPINIHLFLHVLSNSLNPHFSPDFENKEENI